MNYIRKDYRCNYLDFRKSNSDVILSSECNKGKQVPINLKDCNITKNLKNSELNTINEETTKNMNKNIFNISNENNILNKSDDILNNSLVFEGDLVDTLKDFNKDTNLRLYPKNKENEVLEVSINYKGDLKNDISIVQEENKKIEKYVINNIDTALMEDSLNIRDDLNVNINKNESNGVLENLTINNININTTLNENLQ